MIQEEYLRIRKKKVVINVFLIPKDLSYTSEGYHDDQAISNRILINTQKGNVENNQSKLFVAKLLVLNFKFPVKIKHFLCYLQVISCIFLSIGNTVSVVEMTFANIQTRIIEKLQNFPKFENYLLNRFLHWEYYLQEVNLSGFSF